MINRNRLHDQNRQESVSNKTVPYVAGGGIADLKKEKKLGDGPIQNYNSAFLGPNLWEKPGNHQNGSDFDLEYMDLDEFLSENGIPINLEDSGSAQEVRTVRSNNSNNEDFLTCTYYIIYTIIYTPTYTCLSNFRIICLQIH